MSTSTISDRVLDLEIKTVDESSQKLPNKFVENQHKLNSCKKPHKFSIPLRGIYGQVVRWQCSSCEGEVSDDARRWYAQGLVHARRESDTSYPDLPVEERDVSTEDTRVRDTQALPPDLDFML